MISPHLVNFLGRNNLERLTVVLNDTGGGNIFTRRYAVCAIPASPIIDLDGKVVRQTCSTYQAQNSIEPLMRGETVE